MASFFCLTTTLAVVFRFYSRRLLRIRYGADDWLAVVSMVFLTATQTLDH